MQNPNSEVVHVRTCPVQLYVTASYRITTPSCYFEPAALSILVFSIDKVEELVDLSLLPEDTGKPDVLPESLGLPLRLTGEEKKKHDTMQKKKRALSESTEVTNGLGLLSHQTVPSLLICIK